MENYKFIDITQLPDDLWQDAKNLIAIDSNGDVIKAEKQDSYSKDEIDDLLKDAEISADKLQSKIKINSASTDYVVTQPTVSGDSLVITDAISDKNQYHTFGYDKSFTYEGGVYRTDFIFEEQNNRYYSCPDWDVDNNTLTMNVNSESYGQFQFQIFDSNFKKTAIDITISEGSITLSKTTPNNLFLSSYNSILSIKIDGKDFSYFPGVLYGSVSKTFGNNSNIVFKLGKLGTVYGMSVPPSIRTTGEQNILQSIETVTGNTSDYPERLNDYIRYSNDVKAYILTDKNTKFKTINGQQITGDGNIEISTDVDLSNLATKSELNTKQDVITDLDSIRSGAALGATALQEVPDTYALKSEIPDITTKQDKLVSGTNIKTINGTSLLGSGDITIEGGSGNVDLTDYYTKSQTNALVNPKLSQVTLTQAEYDALQTKENNVLYVISDAEDIKFKTINGQQITGEGNITIDTNVDLSNYATKSELATKQDVINDLDSIRSGAALGSTALQSVPSEYATEQWVNSQGFIKEHQDISNLATKAELATKQDTLVSGTNIKSINGTSLLGSGNIEIAKEWIGTQSEYDALPTKDNNTTYYITE